MPDGSSRTMTPSRELTLHAGLDYLLLQEGPTIRLQRGFGTAIAIARARCGDFERLLEQLNASDRETEERLVDLWAASYLARLRDAAFSASIAYDDSTLRLDRHGLERHLRAEGFDGAALDDAVNFAEAVIADLNANPELRPS